MATQETLGCTICGRDNDDNTHSALEITGHLSHSYSPPVPSQILALQKSIHEWAIRKEWRGPKANPRPFVADLGLFHSEISEALEEIRKNDDPQHYWESFTIEIDGVRFRNLTSHQVFVLTGETPEQAELEGKPEGVGPELADLLIRVLETAEEYGLNMDFEIERKMAYNEGREIRHGGLLL